MAVRVEQHDEHQRCVEDTRPWRRKPVDWPIRPRAVWIDLEHLFARPDHPGFVAAQSRPPGSAVQSQDTSAQGGLVSPRLPWER